MGFNGRRRECDQLDERILNLVQGNNRLTSEQIGEQVGLSSTACQRRLKRLRQSGVIEADVSIVDPEAAGFRLQMLVQVTLVRDRWDIVDRFKRAIRSAPEVMHGYYVTGDTDFILAVSARDMAAYEEFARSFLYENPDVETFKTMVVVDRVKAGFLLPFEDETTDKTGRRWSAAERR
ncbi:MAG: Lrp/AsnC family transcriptional regulator [Rhodospirillales bacterium]|nr:Lrp/AsnC family transcriptional regulator [Rhodospirillales bacterium]